jgi:CO/xanthine dehydrogenase FAD-binding subunit
MKYFKPKNLNEAEVLKQKFKSSAYLAGGTIINWKGKPKYDALIDLNNLKLNQINISKTKIIIGACVRVQEIFENNKFPDSLILAAKNFNSLNIRNAATIGGNICDNFFVSNLLPILLSYDAKVKFYLNKKTKICSIKEWIENKKGILTEIIIDKLDRIILQRQDKISEMDVSSIVTAFGYKSEKNQIKEIIIAVSGAEANTILLTNTVNYLYNIDFKNISEIDLKKAVNRDIKFIQNIKVSKRVKLNLIISHLNDILKSI